MIQNLKNYREKFGYTQNQVANFLNINSSLLNSYENGEKEISILHLHCIVNLFGIKLEDLLEKNMEKNNISSVVRLNVDLTEVDIKSIASFHKVVKNYIQMKKMVR